jgi:hypothetical protein
MSNGSTKFFHNGTRRRIEIRGETTHMSKASNPDWQIYYDYLDSLREEGTVNMFGAGPYLADVFDLNKLEARSILLKWRDEFSKKS